MIPVIRLRKSLVVFIKNTGIREMGPRSPPPIPKNYLGITSLKAPGLLQYFKQYPEETEFGPSTKKSCVIGSTLILSPTGGSGLLAS